MKKLLLSVTVVLLFWQLRAQPNSSLEVESYQLANGLTIFLNPDTTTSNVYGAVMVNAGAKHEDPDATGMAHYLEHLLFKGTNKMGTSSYENEKPFLDSINVLYEKLAQVKDAKERPAIQKLINQQALKASKFGLPNEFDKLLKSIGGTNINAFTNYEMTVYHNSFPSHEITRWLNIYSERFRNPVFRSFQSELEVVYEEKNRAMDNFERKIGDQVSKHLYPNLPFGQWSVLGKTEHLKTPSLIKMYDFFNKYYVANNMALILTGNFESEKIKPLIEQAFRGLKSGEIKPLNLPELRGFSGVEKHNARMTPVKVGFTGFQTVGYVHPDRAALDVYEKMLSNDSGTGKVDRLGQQNEILFAGTIPSTYNEVGGFTLFYVPKILIQSLGGAEKKFLRIIDEINSGNIDEELFQIAKNELQISFKKRLSVKVGRGRMIGEAFNMGKEWKDFIRYPADVQSVTKEDIIRVGNKYFKDDRMKFISRTGFPKKNKLKKPPYKPIVTDQKGSSTYAGEFEKISELPFKPKFIDFKKDVETKTVNGSHQLYASKNTVNDLFNFTIKFKKGWADEELASIASRLMEYSGGGKYNGAALKTAFAVEGIDYNVWADYNFYSFNISGNGGSFDKALELLNLLMTDPKTDEATKTAYLNELFTDRKRQKANTSFLSSALFDYARVGKRAPNLTRISSKEAKNLAHQKVSDVSKEIATTYNAEIIYHGNLDLNTVGSKIEKHLDIAKSGKESKYKNFDFDSVSKNKIYLLHDKSAVQSQIYYYLPGDHFNRADFAVKSAFNQYFGGGFSGLVLQEIREYRSLAYSANSFYVEPTIPASKGWLYGYIGCQADKTNNAISVMNDLISDMPAKEDRIESLQKTMQLKVVTSYPDPSRIPYTVIEDQHKGYETDPNKKAYESYKTISMDDIMRFYEKSVKGLPLVITIYGDKRNIDIEKLREIGEVIEVKKTDVATF